MKDNETEIGDQGPVTAVELLEKRTLIFKIILTRKKIYIFYSFQSPFQKEGVQ
jgi:hypothetical protein